MNRSTLHVCRFMTGCLAYVFLGVCDEILDHVFDGVGYGDAARLGRR